MKSSEEILAEILYSIRHIYGRPEMYGTTKRAIDATLFTYHRMWGFALGRELEMRKALGAALGNHNTDAHYIGHDGPPVEDPSAVIALWQDVDRRLGIVLPEL